MVLSDGEDTSSLVTFDEVLDVAKRSQTVIYTIGLGLEDPAGRLPPANGEFGLRRLAGETGGRLFLAKRPEDLSEELEYPFHDWTAVITTCGRICYQRRKINVSQVFAGQKVGVKQVDDHIWLVTFMDYDLGYFDDETARLEPIDNPFGPKLLPMSPE